MAILIPHTGDPPRHISPAVPPAFSLTELQQLVGGFIEALPLSWLVTSTESMGGHDRDPLVMVINEDGKALQLPANRFATAMARGVITPGDVIVGTVVVCTRVEVGQ